MYVCVYLHTDLSFFIHSSVDRRSGCFQILAVVNYAAMNMGVHTAFWESDFISFGRTLRSRVAGLHGTSSIFNFLRHLHTIFHNGSMNLHPHHSAQRGPFLLILADRARAALPCSAHQPLSLHLLTRNMLLRIRWSVSLLNESTKDNALSPSLC